MTFFMVALNSDFRTVEIGEFSKNRHKMWVFYQNALNFVLNECDLYFMVPIKLESAGIQEKYITYKLRSITISFVAYS